MSFTCGVRFTESLSSARHVVLFVTVLALSSPAGVAVGLLVTGEGGRTAVASAALQGLAAGSFIYVTFFEVLYAHLSSQRATPHDAARLLNVVAVVIGFACLTVLEMATLNFTHEP